VVDGSNLAKARVEFNGTIARELAAQVGADARWTGKGSTRFGYLTDTERFVTVAGARERDEVHLALAYGLAYRGHKRLDLVLPEERAFYTLQRAPWFSREARPEV